MDQLFTLGNVPNRNGAFALISCNSAPGRLDHQDHQHRPQDIHGGSVMARFALLGAAAILSAGLATP